MGWRGPDYPGELPTLGWTVLDWLTTYLPSPLDETEPLVLTDSQARNVLEWYAFGPDTGVFVHRRGYDRESKGAGKSPKAGMLCLAELAGPVRFDGWDSNGEPVARPWGEGGDPPAWVQVAAVTEDQAANTYHEVLYFLTANDGQAAEELGIDAGKTRLELEGYNRRGRLEAVTSSGRAREGQRTTFAVLDETHEWVPSRGGPALAATLRRNAAKMDGRTWETTNAFVPGEESVAEATWKAINDGKEGIFSYQPEGPTVDPDDDDETLRRAFAQAYRDAYWINLDRLVRESRDMPWPDVERFFCNRIVKGARKAVDPAQWEALADPDDAILDGASVGVGFDGSETDDHTALVVTRLADEGIRQELHGYWVPTDYLDGKIPRLEVEEALQAVFDRFKVERMLYDPYGWRSEGERWARRWGEKTVLEYPQTTARMGPATDAWLHAITEGELPWDGSEEFRRDVLNAYAKRSTRKAQGRKWPLLTKGPDPTRKIDAAVAAVMSYEAAITAEPEEVEEVYDGPLFVGV